MRNAGYAPGSSLQFVLVLQFGAVVGSIDSSTLMYGYIANHFPVKCRGAAVGAALGLGRFGAIPRPLVGGWVIGAGFGHQWSFYAFAFPAVIAALVLAAIPSARQV
ncbi:MAG: hypothetical protein QM674_12960 [Burkholderiaceae bacterium]